ncbi:hypothetical protein ACIRD9_42585 [Streptomyces violaceus]|uniref:hypothetical protein n=1 Tax=Streptomyces violaceus TaxID=1936 RepID=UPI0037F34D33
MPAKPVGKTVPVAQLAWAIREVETGGIPDNKRYSTINSIGATGAYQVMRFNIANWTREVLGKSMPESQWLGNKAAQDKVAMTKLGASQKKYGSWESAAAVWFSGQPNPGSSASDGGNTVRQYVNKVGKFLQTGKTIDGSAGVDVGGATNAGLPDGLMGALTGIAKPFVDIAAALLSVGKFAEFLLKLALPSTWVRIACGLFGIAFLLSGLVVLGLEATKGGG